LIIFLKLLKLRNTYEDMERYKRLRKIHKDTVFEKRRKKTPKVIIAEEYPLNILSFKIICFNLSI